MIRVRRAAPVSTAVVFETAPSRGPSRNGERAADVPHHPWRWCSRTWGGRARDGSRPRDAAATQCARGASASRGGQSRQVVRFAARLTCAVLSYQDGALDSGLAAAAGPTRCRSLYVGSEAAASVPQLASRRSPSADGEPGSAWYVMKAQPRPVPLGGRELAPVAEVGRRGPSGSRRGSATRQLLGDIFGSANTSHGCVGLQDVEGANDPNTPGAWSYDDPSSVTWSSSRTPATRPSPRTTASTAGTWTGPSGRRVRRSDRFRVRTTAPAAPHRGGRRCLVSGGVSRCSSSPGAGRAPACRRGRPG